MYKIMILLIILTMSCSTQQLYIYYPLKSAYELKWENITPQEYDYTCGAAALSTLIYGYFGEYISESKIINQLINNLNEKDIDIVKKQGFNMLHLKYVAEYFGYDAVGVKIDINTLYRLKGPVIIVLQTSNGNHYVVFKNIVKDRVFIADSINGNYIMTTSYLSSVWDGTALILGKKGVGLVDKYKLQISEEYKKEPAPQLYQARRYNKSAPRNIINK